MTLRDKCKRGADEGLTQAETARRFGLLRGSVSYAAKRYGIKFAETPSACEKYIECAGRGMTRAETASHLGVTLRAVSRASNEYKICFAPSKGRQSSARQKYEECAARGMTQGEAARHLGVSQSAVSNAASRYCIKFASAKGRKAGIPTLGYPSLSAAARAMGIHRRVLVRKLAKVSPK